MADDTTTTTDSTSSVLDTGMANVLDALVAIMQNATRPDTLEVQRLLLQRLAYQGDVFPSRIPVPANITEVGGYLNLLESLGQQDMRVSAVASALGIAGPPPDSVSLTGVIPVGFIDVANDRPAGPAQASIPITISVRADFQASLLTALNTLHASGCQLPLRAPRAVLPANQPGATAVSLDRSAVMAALGRSLEVFPGTVLVDPAIDPLAMARLETPATSPIQLVARELDGGTLVPIASWIAKRASLTSVADDPPTNRQYLAVAPIMESAGWYQLEAVEAPVSLASPGSLVDFENRTGLIAGETTLGEELELLYTPSAIARSAFSLVTAWVWDGSNFVSPG